MGYKKRSRKEPAPRMEDADLKAFVKDWLAGRIFSTAHLRAELDKLPHVFMPLAFGALEHFDAKTVGLLWVNLTKDRPLPMAINGLPMFAMVRVMHKDDWDRARDAIIRERDRLEEIKV